MTFNADQWILQNNADVTTRELQTDNEMQNSWNWHLETENYILVQKHMGRLIIRMALMVFVADHSLDLTFCVICRPNLLDICFKTNMLHIIMWSKHDIKESATLKTRSICCVSRIVHSKKKNDRQFCHYLVNLMSFQTCMDFFLLTNVFCLYS